MASGQRETSVGLSFPSHASIITNEINKADPIMKGLYTSNEKRCFFFREFRFIQEKIRFILLAGDTLVRSFGVYDISETPKIEHGGKRSPT